MTIIKQQVYQLDARGYINKRGRSRKIKVKTIKLPCCDQDGMRYQTTIVGGPEGGSTWRYRTFKEAIEGHSSTKLYIELLHTEEK